MLLKKFYLLLSPDSDLGGVGTLERDRGDFVGDDDDDLDPENPDAKKEPEKKDAEPEQKAEDKEPEHKEPEHKKDSRIPLNRHKEILAKERAQREELERKLAQFQQGEKLADMNADLTAKEDNILKMEKEYATLLSDGEIDKATAVMQKIRQTEREIAEAKSDMRIHAAEIRAVERARYSTALERIESAFPVLNPDHEEYDESTMQEVVELKSAYELKGLTPTAALQKAVKLIVEPRTTRQNAAVSAQPRVADKDVAAERKKEAVEKVTEAVKKTPPALTKAGLNSDALGGSELDPQAVIKMTQAEFAKLSEAQLRKMRGDDM